MAPPHLAASRPTFSPLNAYDLEIARGRPRTPTQHTPNQGPLMSLCKGLGGAAGLTALLLGATALAGGALAATPAMSPETHSLSVTESPFGTMPDGQKVEMYRLRNAEGMEVDMITYGARVQAIKVPDKNGKIDDIALGFDDMKGYLGPDDPYFGATIGRYANRIAKGKFALDGKTYSLPVNNGPNSLHGGTTGFDKKVWAASEIKTPSSVGVEFTLFSS